jgi:hypothetical protein
MRLLFSCAALLFSIFISEGIQAQEASSQELDIRDLTVPEEKPEILVLQRLYEVLQEKNATSGDVAVLAPDIEWSKVVIPTGVDRRYNILLSDVMQDEWVSLLFKDLDFRSEGNTVVVSGIVNGRRTTECEMVSNRFEHHWSLKGEKITSFTE